MDSKMSSSTTLPERQELKDSWFKYSDEGHKAFESKRYAFSEIKFLAALKAAETLAEGLKSGEMAKLAKDSEQREDLERLSKTLNNLAAIYHLQGKYQLAEEAHERCLDVRLDLFGEEHLDTAVTLFNLAVLHCAKRRWEKAEILYKRVLEIREKLLGKNDSQLVPVLKNYAVMLQKVERMDEATALEARAKEIANLNIT